MKEIFLIFYLSINLIICNSNFTLLPISEKIKVDNKKNLVIGVIERYTWIKIKIFISYIKANFTNCDCILFYRRVKHDTLNKIRSLGITTIKIPNNILE